MKQLYEAPGIADEQSLEVAALSCNKIPGWGDPNFCGPVWASPHGNQAGCYTNPNSRSS